MASILRFEQRSSSLVASTASTIFCQTVRSLCRERRITCMVMVLPPLTTWPLRILSRAARTSEMGFTPG